MRKQLQHLGLVIFLCSSVLAAQKRPSTLKKPAEEKAAYPIVELATSGSERYDADDILKASGLRKDPTAESPLADVKVAAQKLVNTGVFAEVSYKHTAIPGGMKVEFVLGDKDDDQFIKCDFANVVWLLEEQLLIELHDRVPLFNGTVPRDGSLADDVSIALQSVLKDHGVNANVASEHQDPINADPSTEEMTYRVADVQIKIAKVDLTGASPEMQGLAAPVSKSIVGLNYNRATIAKFMDRNLRAIYLKHGYLRASFAAPKVSVLSNGPAQTDVALSIPVTEGRTYKIGSVRWSGNKALAANTLDSFLKFPLGAAMDGTELAKAVDKIRVHYASLGYLHMTLTPKPSFDDAAGKANYEMAVKEGDLFSMGKFAVEGLQPASAEKMHHAWLLREGEPFDPTYLRDFFKKFRLPENTAYIVDESEGELPKSVDVTVIFCGPKDPCKPKNENMLYTPPVEGDKEP